MGIISAATIYLTLILIPITLYYGSGITTPFWYWSAGLVSGLTIWVIHTALRTQKPAAHTTTLTDTPQPIEYDECPRCFYYVDSNCWYRYLRCADVTQCGYKPKSPGRQPC